MAQQYQKLELKRFPKAHTIDSSESQFWKKFRFPILLQQYAAVTCIDFNPISPHDFVVTSSARAQIFDASTNEVKKSLNRFKEVAYSARYRGDGQLVVAGGEEGAIRVFDAQNRSVLRTFHQAHKKPIHLTRFAPNNIHIMSGSDDCTVSAWDLQAQESLFTLTGHTDQVRCGAISPSSEHVWVSGSHDHTIKLWDTRTQECIATLQHNNPVEDLLMLPGGGLLLSASGNEIKIWDIIGGFKQIDSISPHQKAITSLAFDPSRSRLFTSSLDNSVKVFDTNTYKIIHVIKYPAPVLTVGISPQSTHLVTGMSDGMLSIRHRVIKMEEEVKEKSFALPYTTNQANNLAGITKAYLMRGMSNKGDGAEYKVEKIKKQKLRAYDQYLRKFQYKKALDAAMDTKDPIVICSLLEEFTRRQSLSVPLSGRNEITLKPIIQFLVSYVRNPKFTSVILPVANHILDLYAPVIGMSPVVDKLFLKLHHRIREEIEFQKNLMSLQGIFDALFASSSLARSKTTVESAQTQDVIDINK